MWIPKSLELISTSLKGHLEKWTFITMINQSNAVYSKGILWMPLNCFCNIEEKLAAKGIYWLASMLFQVGYIYTAL